MKQVSEMPTSGQFIIVFYDEGKICADTMIYNNYGVLMSVSLGREIWKREIEESIKPRMAEMNASYYVAD